MKKLLLFTIFSAAVISAAAQQKPRLVVNIVVSQMRYDYLSRFDAGFGDRGFKRLAAEGNNFTQAHYTFSQTTTPAALASLQTGSYPDMHGITSTKWIDYTTNKPVSLAEDKTCYGLDCDSGIGQYSSANLILPTIGDRIKSSDKRSKVVTIALDPVSAVIMGGKTTDVYWLDKSRGTWISSTGYMSNLPEWVLNYNRARPGDQFAGYHWLPSRKADRYVNEYNHVIDFDTRATALRSSFSKDYPVILQSPAGNVMVREFAKQAIIYEDLGKDSSVDLLNICFDAPRFIGQHYGSQSKEIEDTFYRLDEDIADLIDFVASQVPLENVLFVLTSDHGASGGWKGHKDERDYLDRDLFRLLINGFLSAQYFPGEWTVDFFDGQLYLNHDLIFSRGLALSEIQAKVAAFALQFRGVSHAITASSLTGSYFGSGFARKMQRSFYPKRSGDLMINLMPEWIYENGSVSNSGSMYEYDTHVPLFFFGAGIKPQKVSEHVDICSIAPTLARVLDISRPFMCETSPIKEIAEQYEN